MSDLPNLDAAHAAEPNMADLRHTWEPWGRYTCPACGEALLKRDPNDLCPAKVALRLATVDTLTRERDHERQQANEWLAQLHDARKERNEARQIVNACMGAVPVTTVAFAGDVPLYLRSCFDAVAAEHRESVAGLTRAVDAAADRIGEVVRERDEARAALTEAEAAGWRRGMVEASRAVHERGMHLADHDQRLEHDRTELTILAKVTT